MNYERKLIFQDEALAGKILSDLNQYLPLLNAVKAGYEGLHLGPFDNQIFRELIHQGTDRIAQVYNDTLQDQLNKSGISNPILRKTALSGTMVPWNQLTEALTDLRHFSPKQSSTEYRITLSIEAIIFENGTFTVSAESKEQIIEDFCRIYITSEKEQEFYDAFKAIADARNKLWELVERHGLRTEIPLHHSHRPLDRFFKTDEKDMKTPIPEIAEFVRRMTAKTFS